MAWVYRYIDVFDNIKYIGIVWGPDRTLDQRINEHTIDWWYKESPSWKIEYMEENVPNRATAEALESHYIAKYNTGYINGNGFNKSKEGWGEIAAFNHNKENWIPYDNSLNPYFVTYSDISKDEWLNAGQQRPLSYKDREKCIKKIAYLEKLISHLETGKLPLCHMEYNEDICLLEKFNPHDNYQFWFRWIDARILSLLKVLSSWSNFLSLEYLEEYSEHNEEISLWLSKTLLYIEQSPDNKNCPIYRNIPLIDGCREERDYGSPKEIYDSRGGHTVIHLSHAMRNIKENQNAFEKEQSALLLHFLKPLITKYKEIYERTEENRKYIIDRLVNEHKKALLMAE